MALLSAYILPHPPLIVPEVGGGQELRIRKTVDACREVARRIAALKPDTLLIVTPHSILYGDYLHISPGTEAEGSFAAFGAPEVRLHASYDTDFVAVLEGLAAEAGIPAGTLGEDGGGLDHATMIPLYFLLPSCKSCQIVRISQSGLSPLEHYRFGTLLREASMELGRRTILIASGDLSHRLEEEGPYGFAEEGPAFDRIVTEAMAAGAFNRFLDLGEDFCDAAGECGLRSFQILAGALDGLAVRSELLSYEGPFGVGYAVAAFEPLGPDEARHFGRAYEASREREALERKAGEDAHVRLARAALEHYIRTGRRLDLPEGLPPEFLDQTAGVFVSLKKDGRLRGCIGTLAPTTANVALEILQNAVSAGTSDPRFDPVAEGELSRLSYSVDVLGPIEDISSRSALDPLRYGVIVYCRGRQALLLPNLEGIGTVEKQLAAVLEKAGIGMEEPYRLQRFEVVRHKAPGL